MSDPEIGPKGVIFDRTFGRKAVHGGSSAVRGSTDYSRFYVNPPGAQPSRTSNKRTGGGADNFGQISKCSPAEAPGGCGAAVALPRASIERCSTGAAAERAFLVILSSISPKYRASNGSTRTTPGPGSHSQLQTHPDRTPPSPLRLVPTPRAHTSQ